MKFSQISRSKGATVIAALAIAKLGLSLSVTGNATPLQLASHESSAKNTIVSLGEQTPNELNCDFAGNKSVMKVAVVSCSANPGTCSC